MSAKSEAKYAMRVAAELTNMHPQTLRKYERQGLLEPSRHDGYHRKYSDEDIERLMVLRELSQDRGVNVAGLRVLMDVLKVARRIEQRLERSPANVARLRKDVSNLRGLLGGAP